MSEKLQPTPRKVLIVEDSRDWRDNFSEEFNREGVEVVIVGSPDEAKELLKKGGFTEVITDGLGGKWKDVADSATDLPVRLVTNDSSLEHEAKIMGIGYVDKTDLDAWRNIAK